jgi:hypothetical protein
MWNGFNIIKFTSTTIEHMLAIEIENTLHVMQTCFKSKEYLVKYMGCHHKEVVWKKLVHLDHFPKMVNKFEQEWGHELGVRKT